MAKKFNLTVYMFCFLAFGLFFVFSGFGMLSLLLAALITLVIFFVR